MISRVLSAALVAGFLAALVASALQAAWTTPLILQAETFEKQAALPDLVRPLVILAHHVPGHADAHAEGADDAWKPADGLQRTAFTSLATLVSGVGYALLLAALLLASGATPTLDTSLRWALGAFLAVNLAPAVGLPPELPGMGGEHLGWRQAWWLATVACTGLGLYLLARFRSVGAAVLAVLILALPHLVGAPHAVAASDVPAGLAAQFAARSLAIGFVFWATLGLALSWAWSRQERRAGTIAAT